MLNCSNLMINFLNSTTKRTNILPKHPLLTNNPLTHQQTTTSKYIRNASAPKNLKKHIRNASAPTNLNQHFKNTNNEKK